jgi:hypothetical protein
VARVMIVSESWMTNRIHHKEFDLFTDAMFEVGVTPLKEALESGGHDVAWMPAHEVQEGFPLHPESLNEIEVLILSDIGANSFLLHPDTWLRGKPTPNRLKLIRDWTLGGGALAMCGGYYSFQVINAGPSTTERRSKGCYRCASHPTTTGWRSAKAPPARWWSLSILSCAASATIGRTARVQPGRCRCARPRPC